MKKAEGLFVQLYVLGQKYHIQELQNDSIDALLYLRTHQDLHLGIVSYSYRNTPDDSPLRSFLVRIAGTRSRRYILTITRRVCVGTSQPTWRRHFVKTGTLTNNYEHLNIQAIVSAKTSIFTTGIRGKNAE
jgi:hypothetical protein